MKRDGGNDDLIKCVPGSNARLTTRTVIDSECRFDLRCKDAQCKSPIQVEHSLQYHAVAGTKNCRPRIGVLLLGAFAYVGIPCKEETEARHQAQCWKGVCNFQLTTFGLFSCHGDSVDFFSTSVCSFECKWLR